mmetsp:Transcript_6173/g.13574  ORF Transcript_6173/g.13574 Transcript_6173/m.13574 type:complete len:619 (-) Transcript_6173:99-1955(-)
MARPQKPSRMRMQCRDSSLDGLDGSDDSSEEFDTAAPAAGADAGMSSSDKKSAPSSPSNKVAEVIDLTSDGGGKVLDVTEALTGDADVDTDDENVRLESAAFGSEPAKLDESDLDSNLADVEPEVGMEIDFRDPDYIWSSAKIVKVSKARGRPSDPSTTGTKGRSTNGKIQVTIRYDGWPSDWDELVSWPSVRVARLFTYTKRVKCLVDGLLVTKKHRGKTIADDGTKIGYCSYWPCTVRFRMPHPAHRARAEELLRLEPNVFVQPYGLQDDIIPPTVLSVSNGGVWLHNNKLRMWRDDTTLSQTMGILPPNFDMAYKISLQDTATPGKLPTKAVELGSLLNADYRVFTLGGEPVNGLMYSGATLDHPKPKAKPIKQLSKKSERERKLRVDEETKVEELKHQLRPRIEVPPTLPAPIAILEPSNSSSEAVRFRRTQRWGAAVSVGGNDLFLGSFPSRTHAAAASSELAFPTDGDAGEHGELATRSRSTKPAGIAKQHTTSTNSFPQDEEQGRRADLNSAKLADSICALEKSCRMQSQDITFSIHDWTMQNIRYHAYLKAKRERVSLGVERVNEDADNSKTSNDADKKKRVLSDAAELKPKGRKQSRPRRLDLTKRVYV